MPTSPPLLNCDLSISKPRALDRYSIVNSMHVLVCKPTGSDSFGQSFWLKRFTLFSLASTAMLDESVVLNLVQVGALKAIHWIQFLGQWGLSQNMQLISGLAFLANTCGHRSPYAVVPQRWVQESLHQPFWSICGACNLLEGIFIFILLTPASHDKALILDGKKNTTEGKRMDIKWRRSTWNTIEALTFGNLLGIWAVAKF